MGIVKPAFSLSNIDVFEARGPIGALKGRLEGLMGSLVSLRGCFWSTLGSILEHFGALFCIPISSQIFGA